MNRFIEFVTSEDGAVTVDWVVLCAAVVGLGVAVATSMESTVKTESGKLGSRIDTEIASVP